MDKKKQAKIEELKKAIQDKQREIDTWEANPDDYVEQYEDMLDEISEVKIGSLTYSASLVLKEVDPTAYRCGLVDYVDSLELEPEELQKELEELQDELEDLESEE